jgi:hypothetical protein
LCKWLVDGSGGVPTEAVKDLAALIKKS